MAKRESRPKTLDRLSGELEAAANELEGLAADYQEWRDNLPENLASSPLAEKLEEAITTLEDAASEVQSSSGELEGLDLPRGFGRD